MFAFGIRYLNGFVAAAEPDSHERAEWPPHPGRVFLALAAAHFQTDADPVEREALQWLERLPVAPALRASEALPRALVTHYVPVNDKAGPATAILQSAPTLTRTRQPRSFARAFPDRDTVYLSWPEVEPPPALRDALAVLCAKVSRIGHSSSLVQMWLASADEIGEPNWVPGEERAEIYLRIAGPGTLDELERRYAVQRRPELPLYEGYARPSSATAAPSAPGTVFSPHFTVLALEPETGPYSQLDLLCVLQLVQRWREAILSESNDLPESVRRLLSGHDENGSPLEEPHLAFVPLAFAGHPHADGRLLGMGLALPEALSREERRLALQAAGRVHRLLLGRLGTWKVISTFDARPARNLRPETWTAYPEGATHWSTVTPVAYDRHPKTEDRAAYQREISAMIAQACTRIGLPEPRETIVTPVSVHLGVPPSHSFPRLRRKDGSQRRHTHAILVFDQPVRGPILLGAGRYRGYGVFRPLDASHHG